MDDLARTLDLAIAAAREAGDLLRRDLHRPDGPRGSGSHAEADVEAETLIRERLLSLTTWNYLGEETGFADRGDRSTTWLVDPNDGTIAYLRGWRGSSVSIALLRDGEPVLGVVYSFAYPDDRGDLIAWAEGGPMTRNGRTVDARLEDGSLETAGRHPAIVFLAQGADRSPEVHAELVAPARFIAVPSIAYRLARVAAGDGVAAVSVHGPTGWDVAAGHALLRAAGGALIDESGRELRYTDDGRVRTRWCFGGGRSAVEALVGRDWQRSVDRPREHEPRLGVLRPRRGRSVADAHRLSRAQGCLLGQIAGDALGGLVEFSTPEAIASKYPGGPRDLEDGGHWGTLAGQPTDDSEMALVLARTLVAEGRYDPLQALDGYLRWWPRAWDRGATLARALDAASAARTPSARLERARQAADPGSQANGSLMRIAPLGIFGAGRPDEVVAWAREDSALTHPHPVCRDACAVFAGTIASVLAEAASPRAVIDTAEALASRHDCDGAVRAALAEARDPALENHTERSGWVLLAIRNAFRQLLHAASLEEALVATVGRGGDTDTNAAIAGALLGAVHGRDAVPERWTLSVLSCRPLPRSGTEHPQPEHLWPVDALLLAEALLLAGTSRWN